VSWLGAIPEHWEIRRFKYSADLINTKIDGASSDLPYTGLEHIESWTGKRISQNGDAISEGQANLYARGDVLFGKLRPYLAKAYAAEIDGICTGELLVLRPKAVKQKFLLDYVLNPDFIAVVDSSTYGAKMPRANWDFIGNLPALIPPSDEQQAITTYLDRETARIDTLIEKKQRQIELLQEKRSALISHAVTKGLDPNAKMKDSGIEWLGNIPGHWKVVALKRVARVGNGSTPSRENPEYWGDEGYPWLNSSVVNLDEVIKPAEFVTATALRECHLPKIQPPAVLVGITGQGKTRGMATTLRIESTINQHLAFLKPNCGVCDVEYLRRVLDLAYHFLRIESEGAGSTKGAITCEQLANLRIPIPPVEEQENIVGHLNQRLIRDANLISNIFKSIEGLREYRTALISAAVTGKIDVRKEVS
jgi:type I restriction enzyme S subunit